MERTWTDGETGCAIAVRLAQIRELTDFLRESGAKAQSCRSKIDIER